MNVILFAHTQLSSRALGLLGDYLNCKYMEDMFEDLDVFEDAGDYQRQISDGILVGFTAIRTCYSHLKPSTIMQVEGEKYFGKVAKDGEGGLEIDRLIREIRRSKHTSTLEHISFTFIIENVSRSLLAQLTRHRIGFSFSVQSQRYVKFSTDSKSAGFEYVMPAKADSDELKLIDKTEDGGLLCGSTKNVFDEAMSAAQAYYDLLIKLGVPQEDARAVLPNAASVNLVMTCNITSLMGFYSKRKKGRGAQAEITELAEAFRREVLEVEPWLEKYFDEV